MEVKFEGNTTPQLSESKKKKTAREKATAAPTEKLKEKVKKENSQPDNQIIDNSPSQVKLK